MSLLWSFLLMAPAMGVGYLALVIQPISHGGALFAVLLAFALLLVLLGVVLMLRLTPLVVVLFVERQNWRSSISRCFSLTKNQVPFMSFCYFYALLFYVFGVAVLGIESSPHINFSEIGGLHLFMFWLVLLPLLGALLAGIYLELRKRAGEDPSQPVEVRSGGESPAS